MFEPQVGLSNQAVDNATLVEVLAEDRPGLLHDLATVISGAGYDIDVVLIDTEAHKALDVFYLKEKGGQVPEEAHAALHRQLIAACGT